MAPVTGTSSVNLTSISNDTLTESFFAGTAQGMVDQKKLVGSRMNAGLRDMNGKRDKQIKELNKYVKELTKGGFFRMFLKIINFVMKMLNPLDAVLEKVMGGKLKWLRMALSFVAQIAMSVFTGGASLIGTVMKEVFKNVAKTALDTAIRIVELVVNLTEKLTAFGGIMMDMAKQKSMALHQTGAQRFQTLAMQAGKTVETNSDEIRRIQEKMTQLIANASETINLEEQGREAMTKL